MHSASLQSAATGSHTIGSHSHSSSNSGGVNEASMAHFSATDADSSIGRCRPPAIGASPEKATEVADTTPADVEVTAAGTRTVYEGAEANNASAAVNAASFVPKGTTAAAFRADDLTADAFAGDAVSPVENVAANQDSTTANGNSATVHALAYSNGDVSKTSKVSVSKGKKKSQGSNHGEQALPIGNSAYHLFVIKTFLHLKDKFPV